MASMTSHVSWAIPSSRTGSYDTGLTRRSEVTPMFFIARTVAAMFTGSWGSKRMTEIRASRDSDIGESEAEKTRGVVTITTKIDEFVGGTGQHELPATACSTGNGLVDEEVQRDLRTVARNIHACGEHPPVFRRLPGSADRETLVPPF